MVEAMYLFGMSAILTIAGLYTDKPWRNRRSCARKGK